MFKIFYSYFQIMATSKPPLPTMARGKQFNVRKSQPTNIYHPLNLANPVNIANPVNLANAISPNPSILPVNSGSFNSKPR